MGRTEVVRALGAPTTSNDVDLGTTEQNKQSPNMAMRLSLTGLFRLYAILLSDYNPMAIFSCSGADDSPLLLKAL